MGRFYFFFIAFLLLLALVFFVASNPPEYFSFNPDSTPQPTESDESDPKNVKISFAGKFTDGRAPVYNGNKWGYMDRSGTWVIQPRFEAALPFSEGIAPAKNNDQWGFIDRSGEWILSSVSDAMTRHSKTGPPFLVAENNRWIYKSSDGDTRIPYRYQWATSFSEEKALVEKNGEIGFIDGDGDTVIGFQFEDGRPFSDGLAAVKKGGKWGYINQRGQFVIEPTYRWGKSFRNGIAPVLHKKKWAYINDAGNTVTRARFDYAGTFSDSRALIKQNDRFGYLNTKGDIVVEPQFRAAGKFSEGRARVLTKTGWGYIDKEGSLQIEPQYELAMDFSDGLAAVYSSRSWTYIDRNGNTALELPVEQPKNQDITDTQYRRARLRKMVELTPIFSRPDRRYYANESDSPPFWKKSSSSENLQPGMYKITRYPYGNPDALQHEAAEELIRLSRFFADRKGWFQYEKGTQRYDNQEFKADALRAHHVSKSYVKDTRVLDPSRPEWLIYYPTPKGRKLAGFMFSTLSNDRGPQIGGALTQWHYHQKQSNRIIRCKRGERLNVREIPCEEQQPVHHTPLMIHVWFVKHSSGPFGSSPKLKPYLMNQLIDKNYPNHRELIESLFCENHCLQGINSER